MGDEGGGHGSMWAVGAVGVVGAVWVVWGVWVARERRGAVGRMGAVWVREGCWWAVSAVRAQCGRWVGDFGGGECGGGGWRRWSCWGSNRALLFFIFWRSFLISWRKGRHVGGEGGGHGSMWAVGAVGVVGAVWVVWGGVGGDYRTLDSLSAGGEEDMYADGARWVCWRRGRHVGGGGGG